MNPNPWGVFFDEHLINDLRDAADGFVNFGTVPPVWERPARPLDVTVTIDGHTYSIPMSTAEINDLRTRGKYAEEREAQRIHAEQARQRAEEHRRRQQQPAPRSWTSSQAITELRTIACVDHDEQLPLGRLIRRAKRHAHPDTGGSSATFNRVTELEQSLRRAGLVA